jgi:hypothetical protein
MDAKVHPARPVHHPDAEEMNGLVRPHLRLTAAVESAGLAADLDVAVRHNFLESFPEPVRDFHPSASADVEAESAARPARTGMPPRVASVDPELAAPVVLAELSAHPGLHSNQGQFHRVAQRPEAAHLEDATALRVAVLPDAEPQEMSWLLAQSALQALQPPELLVSRAQV